MHDEGEGHPTAIRKLCREPAGLGVGWMCHVCPFHRSTKVVSVPEGLTASPTAVHADGALHATPASELTLAPDGFGVRWTLHFLPLNRSTNVTPTFDAVT